MSMKHGGEGINNNKPEARLQKPFTEDAMDEAAALVAKLVRDYEFKKPTQQSPGPRNLSEMNKNITH